MGGAKPAGAGLSTAAPGVDGQGHGEEGEDQDPDGEDLVVHHSSFQWSPRGAGRGMMTASTRKANTRMAMVQKVSAVTAAPDEGGQLGVMRGAAN